MTHHPFDRWFEMRNEVREAYVNRKALLRMIADFVQKILPSNTPSHRTKVDFSDNPTTPLKQTVTHPPPKRSVHSDSHEIMYETPSSSQERGVLEDEEEEEV